MHKRKVWDNAERSHSWGLMDGGDTGGGLGHQRTKGANKSYCPLQGTNYWDWQVSPYMCLTRKHTQRLEGAQTGFSQSRSILMD